MRSSGSGTRFTIALVLTFCAVYLAGLTQKLDAQPLQQDQFKLEDLTGRWERWPDNRDEKGIWLYTYIRTAPDQSLVVDLKISDLEQNEFGPSRPGRTPSFSGTFDSDGFDVFYECSTRDLCYPRKFNATSANKPIPDVVPRSLRTSNDIRVRYRYNIKPIRKDLLLVTAYTPSYTIGDKIFSTAKAEAKVRQFYLTRTDRCLKARDEVKKQIIDGEFSDRFVLAFGSPLPLSPGSKVYEDNIAPLKKLEFRKAACFLFVDLMPASMFGHPVLYVSADPATGRILEKEWAYAPPLIRDPKRSEGKWQRPYDTVEDRWSSPDLVFPTKSEDLNRPLAGAPVKPKLPSLEPIVEARDRQRPGFNRYQFRSVSYRPEEVKPKTACTETKKVAVLVNGGRDKGLDTNLSRMSQLLLEAGFDRIPIVDYRNYSLDKVRSKIKEMAAGLGECDVFTLYITGHGAEYDIKDSELKSNGELLFKDPNVEFSGNDPNSYKIWSVSNQESNKNPINGIEMGPGILFSLRGIKAGYVQLILDYCFSGSVVYAAVLPEWGGPPIANYFSQNQNLSIYTGAKMDEPVLFRNEDDPSLRDQLGATAFSGGTFTNVFLVEMTKLLRESGRGSNLGLKEYHDISRRAMENTTDEFTGFFDELDYRLNLTFMPFGFTIIPFRFKGRSQDPQSCEIVGGLNRCN